MIAVADGVYAEPGLSTDDMAELKTAFQSAVGNVTNAFGQLHLGPPLTLFCRSGGCKLALGAAPEAAAANDLGFTVDGVSTTTGHLVRTTIVVTGPNSKTARIATHEMVHAEMKSWLAYDALPTWFNEGVATFIASEPNCTSFPPAMLFDVTALDTKAKWQQHIRGGKTLATYCEARNHVAAWAAQYPDPVTFSAAVRRIMATVADGGGFAM